MNIHKNRYGQEFTQEKFKDIVSQIVKSSELIKKNMATTTTRTITYNYKLEDQIKGNINSGNTILNRLITEELDKELLDRMKSAAIKYKPELENVENKSKTFTLKNIIIGSSILLCTVIIVGIIEGLKDERNISND